MYGMARWCMYGMVWYGTYGCLFIKLFICLELNVGITTDPLIVSSGVPKYSCLSNSDD